MESRSFECLALVPRLLQGLKSMHLSIATEIQYAAWHSIISQKSDTVIFGETGSGKTLSYLLPLIQLLISPRAGNGKEESTEPNTYKETTFSLSLGGNKIARNIGVLLLILVPTRELAQQTLQVSRTLLRFVPFLVSGSVTGGVSRSKEKAQLRKGNHILVATPGRLLDHLRSTQSFVLNALQFLVLDEADRILSEGLENDVNIFNDMLERRSPASHIKQKILVSATMSPHVIRLAHSTLREADIVQVDRDSERRDGKRDGTLSRVQEEAKKNYTPSMTKKMTPRFIVPSTLTQLYVVCPTKRRTVTLLALLKEYEDKMEYDEQGEASSHAGADRQSSVTSDKVIVFVNTMAEVDFLYLVCSQLPKPESWRRVRSLRTRTRTVEDGGKVWRWENSNSIQTLDSETGFEKEFFYSKINFFRLHGAMKQHERSAIYDTFRSKKKSVLFCSDIASRGIDIADITCVVQFSPPLDEASYVHRTGRTARMGRRGLSLLFLSPHEESFVTYLASLGLHLQRRDAESWLYHLLRSRIPTNKFTIEESVYEVQNIFQSFIHTSNDAKAAAIRAFRAWRASYSTFPPHFWKYFDAKQLHLGFLAQSFGISSSPHTLKRGRVDNARKGGTKIGSEYVPTPFS